MTASWGCDLWVRRKRILRNLPKKIGSWLMNLIGAGMKLARMPPEGAQLTTKRRETVGGIERSDGNPVSEPVRVSWPDDPQRLSGDLSLDDWCYLSQQFNCVADLGHSQDCQINEWLKANIVRVHDEGVGVGAMNV